MPTSKRNYLTLTELAEYADITITDNAEALDRISQAEELLDGYVGYVHPAMDIIWTGLASAGSTTTLHLDPLQTIPEYKDYFKGCIVEVIGGAGEGQQSRITGSTVEGVLTFDAVTTPLDNTSYYKIYQVGKFPRVEDQVWDTEHTPAACYKSIPEAVRRATAAQVEYMITMGDDYFSSDKSNLSREQISDYESEKEAGTANLIAPKAKTLLRGYVVRTGSITV